MKSVWGMRANKLADREARRYTGKGVVSETDDAHARVKYMEDYLSKDKKYIPYEKRAAYESAMKQRSMKQKQHNDAIKPILIIVAIAIAVGYILYSTGALNIP
jgi:hypothetical protein